ncbi:unannotated protein [freshwater metagenome]|uniref:Unannotated protein n=1 Tax=freshwater metagenome TaxID=449393 RepID=A0A6J6IG38_9ZZZZ
MKNVEAAATSRKERDDHAENESDIANAVREERFECCVGVLLFFPPMSDEAERTDAYEFPAHQHLQRVRAEHVEEH